MNAREEEAKAMERIEIRKEAIDGIKLVQSAGIKTVMITGDNKNTAISIGKETGILKEDGIVLTSDEMNNMSDEKLKEIIPNEIG